MKLLSVFIFVLLAHNSAFATAPCDENLNLVCYSEFLKLDETTTWGPSASTDVAVLDDDQPDLCSAHMVMTTVLGQIIADYSDASQLLDVSFQTGMNVESVVKEAPISSERIKHVIIPVDNDPLYKALILSCSLYSNQ